VSDAGVDEKVTEMFGSGTGFEIRNREDGFGSTNVWLRMARTGTTATEIELNATTFDFNGTLDIDGGNHDIATTGTITLSGSGETLAIFRDDAEVELYYDNVNVFETLPAASGGAQVNNTLTGVGFERVLTTSDITGSGFLPADP